MVVFNLDLAYLMPFAHCSLSLPYQDKLLLHLLTPLAFFLSVVLAQSVAVNIGKHKKAPERLLAEKNVGGTILLQLGMLIYPSLQTRIFSAFRCFPVKVGATATEIRMFLEGDFSIECFAPESIHTKLIVPVASLAIIVYTVGFPIFLVWELYRHRDSLHDHNHHHHQHTRLRLGSLYEAFENKFWFWEPIIVVYKMLLVGGLSVVEQHSPIQMFVGFLVCFFYMLLVLRASPYDDESLDKLSFFSSLSMCLTLLFGLLKSMDENRAEALESEQPWEVPDELLSTALIVLNIIPFVYAGLSTGLRWWNHRKEIMQGLSEGLSDTFHLDALPNLNSAKKNSTKVSPALDAVNNPTTTAVVEKAEKDANFRDWK
jgi:hypothetical protein